LAKKECDVVVVGAGTAGLTAAMFAARHGLRTVLLERLMGGAQIINAEKIENFPGLPQGLSGAELGASMQEQTVKAGVEILLEEVFSLGLESPKFVVTSDVRDYLTKSVIVATGSGLRRLGIAGEDEFTGNGVSHCATCDGPFFTNEVVGVVGGGDTAADEAISLTSYAEKVILFHRRDRLRAQQVLQQRLIRQPKIEIMWNTVVERILGSDTVTGVQTRNVITNLEHRLSLSGMFVYVGLTPNSSLLGNLLMLDNGGHIPVNLRMETSVPGIFAAGDVRQHSAAQLVSAAGDGATAAISAYHYISNSRSR
jgi:thioredoxin reductase (NADPH)